MTGFSSAVQGNAQARVSTFGATGGRRAQPSRRGLTKEAGPLHDRLALSQAKPSQAKPSQAKPSQAKPSQAKPSQAALLASSWYHLRLTASQPESSPAAGHCAATSRPASSSDSLASSALRTVAGLLLSLTLFAGFATEAQAASRLLVLEPPPDALEGHSGTSDRYFTVRLTRPSLNRVEYRVCFTGGSDVYLDLDGGTSDSGEDFQPLLGTTPQTSNCVQSFILAGQTRPSSSQRIGIRVQGDTHDVVTDEVTATLSLISPTWDGTAVKNQTIRPITHKILNDDSELFFGSDVTGYEGEWVIVKVFLGFPMVKKTTLQIRPDRGTATLGSDYQGSSWPVTFYPNSTYAYTRIKLIDDDDFEGDEAFILEVDPASLPDGLTVDSGGNEVRVNIKDTEYELDLPSGSITVREDAGGASVQVSISQAQRRPVGVRVTFQDLSATAGVDYRRQHFTFRNGVLTFAPGETSKRFYIPIISDGAENESNELFRITLTQTVGGEMPQTRDIIIREPFSDEVRSHLSVERMGPATIQEGQNAQFKLKMNPPIQRDSGVVVALFVNKDNGGGWSYYHPVAFDDGDSEKILSVPIERDGRNTDGSIKALARGPGDHAAAYGPYYAGGFSASATVYFTDDPDPQRNQAPTIQAPSARVTNLQLAEVDATSASVSWDAVEHATSYDVSWSAESSDSLNAVAGAESVTGASATIQHDAGELMMLTVTVTPEYVDENGDTVALDSLAGTATLAVGPGGTQSADSQTSACVSAALLADVREYAGETWRTSPGHVERWSRVLAAFGESNAYSTNPMTVAEAQAQADRGLPRWAPVAPALQCLAAAPQEQPAPAEVQPATPGTPVTPELSLSAGSAVDEGGQATFTLTANPAPGSDLTVTYTVAQSGEYLDTPGAGSRTVTLAAGEASVVLSVATVDDAADEADGSVSVTLGTGTGYTVATDKGSAAVTVRDNDAAAQPAEAQPAPTPAPPSFSISDASAHENTDWRMFFTIRLDRKLDHKVSVTFSTRNTTPVSALDGEDYYGRAGFVVPFFPGQTEKQMWVAIANDNHDEDRETFEAVLSDATDGAVIGDGVGVGTIVNSDPMPKAFLGRFGRTVAQQALDGIASRLAAPRMPGAEGTLAGQAFTFQPRGAQDATPAASSPETSVLEQVAARILPALAPMGAGTDLGDPDRVEAGWPGRNGSMAPTLTLRDVLLGSHFSATSQPDAHGGSFAFWGRAAQATFDGREGAFALNGETTTAMLGTDYAQDRWLVGVSLLQSIGTGGYHDPDGATADVCPDMTAAMQEILCDGAVREGAGAVETTLTAAVPYLAFQASERVQLWGAAGYGAGEVTLTPETGSSLKTDLSWTMAEVGLRGTVFAPPPAGSGPALTVTSDALWTRTSSEKVRNGLAASEADVTRLRLGLEGGWPVALDRFGHLTPTLAVGARHDGGDAETGFGMELGGGLAWHAPAFGLALNLEGRTLLTHRDEDFRDQGVAASFTFDPDPATPLGPSLTVRQDWGGRATGGLDALFAADPLTQQPGSPASSSRWAAEAAWGFPAFGGAFTGSPHVGLGVGPGTRNYTLGWRLVPATAMSALTLGLQATRQEIDAAQPAHTVGLEVTTQW